MRGLLVAALVLGSLAAGCAEPDGDIDEVEVAADDDGKADAASELKVRAGDTSVWITKALVRRGNDVVMRGRTSRNLDSGTGFIADDLFGDFAIRGPRTFEVSWPISQTRTLVDGVNQFVRLGFVHSNGRPDNLHARVIVRPRLEAISGSSKVYLTAELTPIAVGGRLVFRLKARTTGTASEVRVDAGGTAVADVRLADPTHVDIDLAPEHVLALVGTAGAPGLVTITARIDGGAPVTKTARLGYAVKKLGLTAGDAYETWPSFECAADVRACLEALPAGTVDVSSCGDYHETQACPATGAIVDDVAFVAALQEGQARVATAAFRADAAGLAGLDRVEQLQGGAEQVIESRLEGLYGRRYPTVALRTAALTAAVDGAIDTVYARPMDLVDAHEPVAGNLAAMRQVAADALLVELAQFDFAGSAYARPLEELTRTFRAQHVASIRAFRETVALDGATFAGRWLDPYVEVQMDVSTGRALHVLIEID